MKLSSEAALGILVGIAGVGYALIANYRANRVCDALDISLNKLTPVNVEERITDAVIEKAVAKSVEFHVSSMVRKVARDITEEVGNNMRTEVAASVKEAYRDTKGAVKAELDRKVANIDVSQLKAEVIDEAKAAALEKFEDNMENILDDFKRTLQNTAKIYESLAEGMQTRFAKG